MCVNQCARAPTPGSVPGRGPAQRRSACGAARPAGAQTKAVSASTQCTEPPPGWTCGARAPWAPMRSQILALKSRCKAGSGDRSRDSSDKRTKGPARGAQVAARGPRPNPCRPARSSQCVPFVPNGSHGFPATGRAAASLRACTCVRVCPETHPSYVGQASPAHGLPVAARLQRAAAGAGPPALPWTRWQARAPQLAARMQPPCHTPTAARPPTPALAPRSRPRWLPQARARPQQARPPLPF